MKAIGMAAILLALLVAGCSSPTSAPKVASEQGVTEQVSEERVEANSSVLFQGTYHIGATVGTCLEADLCLFAPVVQESIPGFKLNESDAEALAARGGTWTLNATWEATQPLAEVLMVRLIRDPEEVVAYAEGPSPLSANLDPGAMAAGVYRVFVDPPLGRPNVQQDVVVILAHLPGEHSSAE